MSNEPDFYLLLPCVRLTARILKAGLQSNICLVSVIDEMHFLFTPEIKHFCILSMMAVKGINISSKHLHLWRLGLSKILEQKGRVWCAKQFYLLNLHTKFKGSVIQWSNKQYNSQYVWTHSTVKCNHAEWYNWHSKKGKFEFALYCFYQYSLKFKV